jgi:hypothetical protein
MIYRIQKDKDGGFQIAPKSSRKPILASCLIVFAVLCCYGLPYVLLFVTILFGFRHITKQITDNTLLDYYAALKESVICSQLSETDDSVLKRSQYHRHFLEKSQNALYEKRLIQVKEVYFKEENVLETWTAYLVRVENVRNLSNQKLLDNVKHDSIWCKEYLFQQRIN